VVLRRGATETIHHNFLHVGDIINIEYGMAVPVDGIVIQATQLSLDEAAMTGESDEMKKEILKICLQRLEEKKDQEAQNQTKPDKDDGAKMSRTHELPSPLILSGTNIAGGEGRMLCLMVGEYSCLGEIIKTLVERPEVTPL
jgi:magnesium-transporting ATPase (P-type)